MSNIIWIGASFIQYLLLSKDAMINAIIPRCITSWDNLTKVSLPHKYFYLFHAKRKKNMIQGNRI